MQRAIVRFHLCLDFLKNSHYDSLVYIAVRIFPRMDATKPQRRERIFLGSFETFCFEKNDHDDNDALEQNLSSNKALSQVP